MGMEKNAVPNILSQSGDTKAKFRYLRGVHIDAKDMIIAAESEKEHARIILEVMNRAKKKNRKFNKATIQFKVCEVKYLGNIITPEGIRPDELKAKSIKQMPKSHDKHALMCLLGLVKYLSRYIPNELSITEPLCNLLLKNTE